ncbi:hypothetical protein [Winogradskyella sp.]|uniref:hypothetical protein n=1 Tax=Winogradskyella sp. TaxID=1883156 RepID=UPI003BAA004A
MCIKNEKLIFCTCSEKEDKTSDHYVKDIYYTWLLTSYIGYRKSRIRGKILMPSKDLGQGLTLTRILNMLNSDLSYFDFDYHPKELDCLHIDNGLKHPYYQYFSVIYKNNLWQQGRNPAFVSITKTIAQGRILREVSEPKKTNSWLVSQEKLSVSQLFDNLLSDNNDEEQRQFITALANRFPKASFQKALYLCNVNSIKDKISGFRLMAELYESEYNLEQIKSFLFDKLSSENEKEILEILLFALTSNLNVLGDKEIKSLLSLKERSDSFKLRLMDVFSGFNHPLVVDYFIEICRDNNWEVKEEAIMNLSHEYDWDTPEIRKVLWENAENQHKVLRQYAIYGLANRKDNKIKSILEKELQSIDNNDALILEAIEELGDLNMIPLLESKLEKIDKNKHLSKLLLKTIQRMKTNA